jgi:cyclic AMP-responsive element-binding protein 3
MKPFSKVSAQDSRRRKREYMDDMEKRVKLCSEEKEDLEKQIEQLESQNKSLAGLASFLCEGRP